MTIAMQGARTVFVAVVAFTGQRTQDGRVVVAPDGFRCPTRALPLPVLGWMDDGELTWTVNVGMIEEAYVVDRRIVVFGRLDTDPRAQPFVRQLKDGTHRLKIGFSDMQFELLGSPVPEGEWEDEASADLMMVGWSLSAAFVSDHPAWDLPPVQIEDMLT